MIVTRGGAAFPGIPPERDTHTQCVFITVHQSQLQLVQNIRMMMLIIMNTSLSWTRCRCGGHVGSDLYLVMVRVHVPPVLSDETMMVTPVNSAPSSLLHCRSTPRWRFLAELSPR